MRSVYLRSIAQSYETNVVTGRNLALELSQRDLSEVKSKVRAILETFPVNQNGIQAMDFEEMCLEPFQFGGFQEGEVEFVLAQVKKIYPILTTSGMISFLDNLSDSRLDLNELEQFTEKLLKLAADLKDSNKLASLNRLLAVSNGNFGLSSRLVELTQEVGVKIVEDLMFYANYFDGDQQLEELFIKVARTGDSMALAKLAKLASLVSNSTGQSIEELQIIVDTENQVNLQLLTALHGAYTQNFAVSGGLIN